MSRAQGKHPRRGGLINELADLIGAGEPAKTEGELRQEGIGEPRDIPGGKKHLANPPVPKFRVPVPESEWPYRNAILAHGVDPDEAGYQERDARLSGAVNTAARPEEHSASPRQSPVPVYLVEEAGGPDKIRAAAPRSITVPASTNAEGVRVCSLNPRRIRIGLLNEDSATNIRIATDLSGISSGTGALLPFSATSYLWLDTQSELFAIGASGGSTVKLSIIEVTEETAAV